MLGTESTTFTTDVLGRYTCNTLSEALESTDAGKHSGARPFDVIVIGGGSFGAAVAQHLFFLDTQQRRHRILVLEAGKLVLPEHVQNLPAMRGGLGTPGATSIKDLRDAGQDKLPRSEVWGLPWHSNQKFPGLAYCLGGRSIYFGGWSPELLDSELAGWPPAVVADLTGRYFREAADQIGTSETNDFVFGDLHGALRRRVFEGIGQIQDAVALGGLPDHPAARTPGLSKRALLELLGLPFPSPALSVQDCRNLLKLEAPLAVQSRSVRAGAFPVNKFSSVPLLMDAARAAWAESQGDDSRKRLMVADDCHVTGLELDGDRVSLIRTQRGDVPVAGSAVVILALGTIESARLALDALPNPAGLTGRNLMAHLRSNLTLRLPRAAFPNLSAELQTSALFVKGRTPAGRHFHIQVTASGVGAGQADSEAELFKKIPDVDFHEAHKLMTDEFVVITLRGIGEMRGNRAGTGSLVRLDPEPDEFGVPRAFVQLNTTAEDGALWTAMDQAAIELAQAIAASHPVEYLVPHSNPPVWQAVPPPSLPASQGGVRDGLGTTHHEAGTLWMGSDQASSVTNELGRFHSVPNAYAAGPSLFPTVGSPNPMLTGVALARRTAEAIVASAAPSQLEPGFKRLFDGSRIDGWRMAGPGRFIVAGGTLESEGGMGLLWYSGEEYQDLVLRLEWRAAHASDNSGVFVRFADPATDPSVAVNTGYEVQIDDQAPEAVHRTGAIYGFAAPSALASRPVGEWNAYEVSITGQQYAVRLNGQQVTQFTGARALKGFIGLQNHGPGSRVAFRNLRVKAL